ncbi:cupin domain-containing protein [Pontixanthobacter aestiaquae]|uniref:Cupin domain-containing protein n=1 Tax=Pontixanthobacter aestiaquae TaxID=1509367 RepID=A0A844Z924_9SPHN|nr:cupin domain-containing protein [Pontixanthobacter aestiaquae]MDN3645662.1 cupin domain-containing protein [Pontixanthobacter aestiaquae]MXO83340.1 cupin domain-containing protein [Pontixanthobacter aestiaquae]
MRKKFTMLAGLATLMNPGVAMAQNNQVEPQLVLSEGEVMRADAILRELAGDYINDPIAIDSVFGIKLVDQWWTVSVNRIEIASRRGRLTDHSFGPHAVSLTRGEPSEPTWYFDIASIDVLEKIASGEVNAGTAAMKSFSSDRVGVDTRDMEGFSSTSGDQAELYLALSHFFTKGKPEVIRFGRDTSLETHGAQATALHMMKGVRVLHISLGPQQEANADAQLEFGQMPNLFVFTSGTGTLHTDGGPIKVGAGMSVFVQQFVKHHIVNDGEEPLEGILVLYGDNSDFAFGTSYPAYLEDINEWHRQYEFKKQ